MNDPVNRERRCGWGLRCLFAVFLIAGMTAAAATAQESIKHVKDSGFEIRSRPAPVFEHDAHNEKAEVYDCSKCHHVYENGKLAPGQMSVGMECSECHMSDAGSGRMDLIRAYHLQCKSCHVSSRAGPVLCGECHRK